MTNAPRIGCLAWGSLVWEPRDLCVASAWFEDGPLLPVEFCRVDDKGELSTALCEGAGLVPTRWALIEARDIADAREQLRRREDIPASQPESVGSVPERNDGVAHTAAIALWATQHALDGVVWTALPPRFAGVNGRAPTPDAALGYLASLTGDVRARAEDYLQRVPRGITTPIRAAVERRLGWRPS